MLERKRYLPALMIAMILSAIAFTTVADAQRGQPRSGADRRRSPQQGFWAGQRSSLSLNHARSFSRDLHRQSRTAQIVQPQIARSEVTRMRSSIDFAKQELTMVKAEYTELPAVAKYVTEIESHLAKVESEYDALTKACENEDVDEDAIAALTNEIIKELDMAIAEDDAMLRYLEMQALDSEDAAE